MEHERYARLAGNLPRLALVGIVAAILMLLPANPAWAQAQTVVVDEDGQAEAGNCDATTPAPGTIQEGVDAATAGGTVQVCPGTYTEQISINKSLTLTGAGVDQTTIKAPDDIVPNSEAEGVLVDVFNDADVAMSQIKLSGPKPPPLTCDYAEALDIGIWVRGAANLDLDDAAIVDIRDEPLSGCQTGIGVFVGGAFANTTGTATIDNVDFEGYQKGGIVVSNTGSGATITNNTLTGVGPTATIAQNGVQVSGGAVATVRGNTISDHEYTGGDTTAAGIILAEAGAMAVENNTLRDNQIGVDDFDASGLHDFTGNTVRRGEVGISLINTKDALVFGNSIRGTSRAGVDVNGGNEGTTIQANTIANNAGSAVKVDDEFSSGQNSGIVVLGNTLTDNQYGVRLTEGSHAGELEVHQNRIFGNLEAGVRNEGQSTNRIDATNNWWGCNEGPDTPDNPTRCDSIQSPIQAEVDARPWIVMDISSGRDSIFRGGNTQVTVRFLLDRGNGEIARDFPDGTPIEFAAERGRVVPSTDRTENGRAGTTLTSNTRENNARVTAELDAEKVGLNIRVVTRR